MISLIILIFGCLASTSFAISIPSTAFSQPQDKQELTPSKRFTETASGLDDSISPPTGSPTWAVKREAYEQIYVHCQVREQFTPSWGPDAKLCIEELASRGQEPCRATKQEAVLCRKGSTVITSQVIGKSEDTVTSCGNVAVSAGRIMDKCYHQDNTVVGFAIAMGTYTFRVDIRPA